MSLSDERKRIGRRPFTYAEADLSFCDKEYGVGFCNAALGVTGSDRCYKTRATCQVPDRFDRVEARRFAASSDALVRSSTLTTGVSNAGHLVVAFRRSAFGDGISGEVFDAGESANFNNHRIVLRFTSAGQVLLEIRQGGVFVVRLQSQQNYTSASGWVLVMASWGGAGLDANMVINGADVATLLTDSDANIQWFNFDKWVVGGRVSDSNDFNGGAALALFDIGTYYDFRLPAERQRVLSSRGVLRDLSTGLGPFPSTPALYMRGNAADFKVNQGDGGAFTSSTDVDLDEPSTYLSGTVQTLRFYPNQGFVPKGLDGFPFLNGVDITPAKLDPDKGVGSRARASLTFDDAPHHDRGVDPYADLRAYDPTEQGTFWSKLVARHPYYIGRVLRVYSGYLTGDHEAIADNFEMRRYYIERMDGPTKSGRMRVEAKDILKLADNKRAKIPGPARGALAADINATATSFTLVPAGVGEFYRKYQEYGAAAGYLRINSEVIRYTISGDVVTVVERGARNTVADEHTADDSVQPCYDYAADTARTVQELLYDWLVGYVDGVTPQDISLAQWNLNVFPNLYTGLVTEQLGVVAAINELAEVAGFYLWGDERTGLIELRKIEPKTSAAVTLTDDANFKDGGPQVKQDVERRISRVVIHYGQFDPTEDLDKASNYQGIQVTISDAESVTKNPIPVTREVFTRWLDRTARGAAIDVGDRILQRFSEIPFEMVAEVDAKDVPAVNAASPLWLGSLFNARTRLISKPDGSPADKTFLVLSAKETEVGTTYRFDCLEERYEIDPAAERLVEFGVDETGPINARQRYDLQYTPPTGNETVRFLIDEGVILGGRFEFLAEDWPTGTTIILEIVGRLQGAGGGGGPSGGDGFVGGTALYARRPITLIYTGAELWGGGGGGGGSGIVNIGGEPTGAGGGGGAGQPGGAGGRSFELAPGADGSPGTTEAGGVGGIGSGGTNGGAGGGPGLAGSAGFGGSGPGAGGAAGYAIDGLSFVTVSGAAGDLRGPTTG